MRGFVITRLLASVTFTRCEQRTRCSLTFTLMTAAKYSPNGTFALKLILTATRTAVVRVSMSSLVARVFG